MRTSGSTSGSRRTLGTIEMLYERFELEAERREWEEYPSIKTVARYIKFLMGQRGAESARFLAANGTREWKNKRMMKGKRDATSLQVMEYVVGDEHTFDFWVQWTAPNGKIKAVRPKLVAWLDMRSRAIIGDVACVNANSQTLKESLVKMIYSNPGGVPHILHVDNGKDYTAEVMTGRTARTASTAKSTLTSHLTRKRSASIRASASKRSDARCRISLGTNRSNASSPRSARNSPSGLRATRAR